MPAPVLMIHGAFCGGWVFQHFAAPFVAQGREVRALDLPGHGPGEPDDLVAGLSMRDYAMAAAEAARQMAAPPVLVGHSLGGLVALMAAMEIPTAGVILLAPSPPWGVAGSTMEEAASAISLYALGPFWAQAIAPDYATFGRFAVDRLDRHARAAMFERMRPESGRALFETLNWWLDPFMTTLVRPERIGAPILALAGERDVIHPPSTVRETARRIGASFEVMPAMSHWLPGEPGSDAVARVSLDWLASIGAPLAAE